MARTHLPGQDLAVPRLPYESKVLPWPMLTGNAAGSSMVYQILVTAQIGMMSTLDSCTLPLFTDSCLSEESGSNCSCQQLPQLAHADQQVVGGS